MKIAYEYHHSLSLNYQIELKFINTFKGLLLKTSKIYCLVIYFTVCICISPNLYADRAGSIRALFTWAEANYSNLFMPSPAIIQSTPPWTYVYYSETNTYIGVDDKDLVWILGDVFGGQLYIDKLDVMLGQIGYTEADTALNPEFLNGFVPMKPHPTTPNAFLVKQKTRWSIDAQGSNFTSMKSITLYPDGSGLKGWVADKSGVLPSEIHLINPELHSRTLGYFDIINYYIISRENKEYIVIQETGSHTTLEVSEVSTNGTILKDFTTDPGPVRVNLLFDDRKRLSHQFVPNRPEEILVEDSQALIELCQTVQLPSCPRQN